MDKIIKGKAFVLGDNIDTDQIIPAEHLVYSLDDVEEVRNARVTPHPAVEIEEVEGHDLDQQYCWQYALKHAHMFWRYFETKAEQIRTIAGNGQEEGIYD